MRHGPVKPMTLVFTSDGCLPLTLTTGVAQIRLLALQVMLRISQTQGVLYLASLSSAVAIATLWKQHPASVCKLLRVYLVWMV